MKKSLVLVLSLFVALAFAAMVLAQTTPPQQTPPVKPAPAQQTTPAQPPAKPEAKAPETKAPETKAPAAKAAKPVVMKEKKITGMVVSVDAVANTIVIKWKEKELTFKVDPAAKIMQAGKEAKLADIVKDTKVTIGYKIVAKERIAMMIK